MTLKIGDNVKLISKPTGFHSSTYALTLGATYTIKDFEGSNVIIIDDDGRRASFNRERVSL